jgi:hypothetical protein
MYKYIKKIDTKLGSKISLETVGFIGNDEFEKVSQDTMNKSEWESYRNRERFSNDAVLDWLKVLANRESRKFLVYLDINEFIGNPTRLLDFGCGQGHVGVMMMLRGNEVDFCDYTDVVLPNDMYFSSQRFFKADFHEFDKFINYHTILLTQVDYIFSSQELFKFLSKARVQDARVIITNTQIVGPLRHLWNRIRYKRRQRNPHLKKHGYLRSLGVYKRLGYDAGYGRVSFKTSRFRDLWTYSYIIFDL